MDATLVAIQFFNAFLTSIIVPWLVAIERRLSRLEGYIRMCNGGGGGS